MLHLVSIVHWARIGKKILDTTLCQCHSDIMKRITLRLPDDLHQELCRIADQEDRSLNSQILQILRQGAQDKRYEPNIIKATQDTNRRAS
jgi:hypothetical protein